MASKAIGFLNFKFSADLTSFERAMNKAQKGLTKFGKKWKKIGQNMTRNVTLPILGVGIASAKMSMDFDKSMTKIITLVGIADHEVKQMRDSVLELSDKTGIAAAEMAEGLYFLTSAGLKGANALETLEAVAKGTASGLGDMESLSKVAAAAQNAYGVETLKASDALDIFGGMVKTGMFKAEELSQVLGTQLGLASSLGISIEEVGAFISTYTKTTGDATAATTGLSGVMMSFAKVTPKQEEALKKINMTVDDLRDSLSTQGLQKTLIMIASKFKNAGVDLSEFFTKSQALKAVLGVLGNQTNTYIDILDDLSNQQGFVDDAFDRTSKMAGFQMVQAFNQLKNAGIQMGDALGPVITIIADKIKLLAGWFRELSESQKKNIVKWGLILAAIGPVLIIIGHVSIGISALIPLVGKLGKMIVANPWLLLAAAIVIAAKAIYDYTTAVDGAEKASQSLFDLNVNAQVQAKEEERLLKSNLKIARDKTLSDNSRKKAITVLNNKLVGLNETLNLQNIAEVNVTGAIDKHTEAMIHQAKVAGTTDLITETFKELTKATLDAGAAFDDLSFFEQFAEADKVLKAQLFGGKSREEAMKDQGEEISKKYIEGLTEELAKYEDFAKELALEAPEGFEEYVAQLASAGNLMSDVITPTEDLGDVTGDLTKETKMYSDALETVSTNMLFMASSAEDQFKGMLYWTEQLTEAQKVHNATIGLMSDIMFSAAMSAANSQENFFKGFIKGIKEAIKQLLIQLAVMTVINLILGGPTMTIAQAFGSAKLSVLGLAEGGLVTGPTTALIGEGVGTTASNPEVVAPLDKLKSMIGDGNQNIIVEGVLKGNDIYLSNRNTAVNRLRTT